MAFGSYSVFNVSTAYTTAPKTVVQVAPPAAHVIDVLKASLGQSNYLTSSMQTIGLATTTAAATVTSATPVPLNAGSVASSCVGGTSATGREASAEGTTIVILETEDFNTLSSWRYEPVPERRPRITPALFLALRLISAPASSINADGNIVFFELL